MAPALVVAGGIGVGLSFRVERAPAAGETVLAAAMGLVGGGKAANQAIGAAELGARVTLLSAVGADEFGARARSSLVAHGVRDDCVLEVADAATMVGALLVEPCGENRIVVAPGALERLDASHAGRWADRIRVAELCLVSLEVPLDFARAVLEIAREAGVRTLLNPSPAPPGPEAAALAALADVVIPNASEAAAIAGRDDDPPAVAAALRELGAGAVVLTRGEEGALVLDADGPRAIPAAAVDAVRDTSGAGDAFTAALATALAAGAGIDAATAFGCEAAGRIVQGTGFVEALDTWAGLTAPGLAQP